jgi:fimbrial chaperone protein
MTLSTAYWRVLLAILVILPWRAAGYTVSPNLLVLHPSGGDSSAFLHLENKGGKPTAIEVTIEEHRKDIDGKTIAGQDAADDFIIFPAQMVMLPGDEVGVQIRWAGDTKLSRERVYTLVTREVTIPGKPGDESEPNGGLRIAIKVKMNYEVRVYVTPPTAKPNVVVQSVSERSQRPPDDPAGTESALLEVILVNRGAAHRAMTDATLVLAPVDARGAPLTEHAITLPATGIPALKPHILAGDRRRILIPRPPGLPPGPVSVTLTE